MTTMNSRWPWRGGRKHATSLIERAIGEVCPEIEPSTACCLWAAGAQALAGKGRIVAGAFVEVMADGYLRGWGVSHTELALCLNYIPHRFMIEVDNCVGPEGEYAGHAWLEIGKTVVDVMHGFSGPLMVVGHGRVCHHGQRAYVGVPKLAASIRGQWRGQMKAIASVIRAQRNTQG